MDTTRKGLMKYSTQGGGPQAFRKAQRINLDAEIHGTFAEIGAGQECVRWFFRVGGAAATVAESVSAYDMAVSDARYGPSDRYVSRQRLRAMLDREFELLLAQLDAKRGATTSFFVFANTVAARSYSRPQDGDGWLGVRFQQQPRAEPSEIIIHARLFDTENVREQEALGLLGLNLLYGAHYLHADPVVLIRGLMDDLSPGRVEIDMIRFDGPLFRELDNRLMSLQLVEQGFTDAAMFQANGEVVHPAEVLYKKPLVVERGSFRPITNTTLDMLERSMAQCQENLPPGAAAPVAILEMSLRNLMEGDQVDHADFLDRVDVLGALGKIVMISRFSTYVPLPAFLRRYTHEPIVFPIGIPHMKEVLDGRYYADLEAGILEAIGQLFKGDVRLYVYPSADPETGKLVTLDTLAVPPPLVPLVDYLKAQRRIEPIRGLPAAPHEAMPREVLRRLQAGDVTWESLVPELATRLIKARHLFHHRDPTAKPPV
jgi:hypothetical protein